MTGSADAGRRPDEPSRPRRGDRLAAATLWLRLSVVVLGVVVPAVLFDPGSRVFLVKLVGVGLLAGLPGWLYLQFITNRGYSLYDEYVLNLFRLRVDEYANLPAPPQHTSYYRVWHAAHDRLGTTSTDNLYRRKFEAVYGRASVSTRSLFAARTRSRDHSEAFSPVLFATVLFALGWALMLEPELYRSIRLLGDAAVSGRPSLPLEPLQYGFVGAYAFIAQDLIRRYFRDDLRAGAYVAATVRIVFVATLVAALGLVWPAELATEQAVFAFFVGMFPQAGLQALRAAVARPLRRLLPNVATDQPLAQLEGLNIWDEARLMEEGVEDLQNLASANLVDLLLHTRVPVARLVDWIDQACLRLHLPDEGSAQPGLRAGLRRLGIRTATDLQRLWADETHRPAVVGELMAVLDADEGRAAACAAALCASLEGEVNLWHVAQFKERRAPVSRRGTARRPHRPVREAGERRLAEVLPIAGRGTTQCPPHPRPTGGTIMGKHKGQEMKGRTKEAAGSLAGRDDVRAKGRDEQDEAKLKRGVDKVKDTLNPKK